MPRPNRTLNNPELERPYFEIGQRIREARVKAGLDQEELAAKCGMSRVSVMRMETGVQPPSIRVLEALRKDLGADLNRIVCGE